MYEHMPRDASPLKKHIAESPKLRELRLRRRAKKRTSLMLVGAGVIVLCAGIVLLAHLNRFRIRSVVVEGNKVVDTDEVVAVADEVLSGAYAYLIPHRNAFVYPKQRLERRIAATFPRFRSVSASRIDMHTVRVAVSELRGIALWCGADAAAVEAACWFTDESGKIVSAAPTYSGNVYPRLYGGGIAAGDAAPLGKTFVPEADFRALLVFQETLESYGFSVRAIVLGAEERRMLIDLGKGRAAPVRFGATQDIARAAENLSLALDKPELAKKLQNDRVDLEYFDLRFDNKVYYKFAGQE